MREAFDVGPRVRPYAYFCGHRAEPETLLCERCNVEEDNAKRRT